MHITAASYAEVLKNIKATSTDSVASIFKKLTQPVPVDEIKIIDETAAKEAANKESENSKSFDWIQFAKRAGMTILFLILLMFLFPLITWIIFDTQARSAIPGNKKAFLINRALSFYLNQLGFKNKEKSPHENALSLDQQFGTNITTFSDLYQQIKYSKQEASETEKNSMQPFYKSTIKNIKEKISLSKRTVAFLNINRSFQFFKKIKIETNGT